MGGCRCPQSNRAVRGWEYDEKVRVLLAGDAIGAVLWGIMTRGQGLVWDHTGAVRFVDRQSAITRLLNSATTSSVT